MATQGAGNQWLEGEIGLQCCPPGFQADGAMACRPGSTGKWPVVQCGEADEEENEITTYDATRWPANAKVSVPALMLRYRASEAGSSANGGLSTGAIAAIATVIPLVVILGAISAFLLWRRNKNRNAAHLAALNPGSEKAGRPSDSMDTSPADTLVIPKGTAAAHVSAAPSPQSNLHETPEWNVEMDATETERRARIASPEPQVPVAAADTARNAPEVVSVPRVPRKPIARVELDGTPILPEIGDAYIPYRPGAEAR